MLSIISWKHMKGSPVTKNCTLKSKKKLPDFITRSLVTQRLCSKKLPGLFMSLLGNTKLSLWDDWCTDSGFVTTEATMSTFRLLKAYLGPTAFKDQQCNSVRV